jgi:GTPase SAR1 family protein
MSSSEVSSSSSPQEEKTIILFGAEKMGKKSLLSRLVNGNNDVNGNFEYQEIGDEIKYQIPFMRHNLQTLDGLEIQLKMMCLVKEQLYAMSDQQIERIDGVMLVYDVSQSASFNSLKFLKGDLERNKINQSNIPMLAVGTKKDSLVHAENKQIRCPETFTHLRTVLRWLSENHIPLITTTALTGTNVEYAFFLMAKMMLDRQNEEPDWHALGRDDGSDEEGQIQLNININYQFPANYQV